MKVLFIGSFFSGRTGTKSIAEKLSEYWAKNGGPKGILVSGISNRFLRLGSIILHILFYRGRVINVDVFSGRSLLIAKVATRLARIRGLRVILTLRGGRIADELEHRKEDYFEVFDQADYLQTPSYFLAEVISKQLDLRAFYLPNPVDIDHFCKSPHDNREGLLWVRAFSEIYNPEIPIRILSLLKSEYPDLRLTMIGPDKGIQNQSVELVRELNLGDDVDFVGPVANRELESYYRSHAVFLNTTSYESFGTAVVEAAATAMPIVSSKVGELPYLWTHEENILFAEQLDAEGFAKQARMILRDVDLAQDLGSKAASRVQEFEWSKINARWVEVINELSQK